MPIATFSIGSLSYAIRDGDNSDPSRWTLSDWTSWRDRQIESIFAQSPRFGPESILARAEISRKCQEAFEVFERAIRSDPGFWKADGARTKELATFYKFIRAQQWMARRGDDGELSHALALEIPDRDHASFAGKNVAFPELLKSQAFLEKLAEPRKYKDAVEMIEAQNESLPIAHKWIVAPYKAQFIKSVDRTTYGRLLVFIPGDPAAEKGFLEQWFLFAIATPDLSPTPQVVSVSVVAILKPGKSDSAKVFFSDFVRWRDPFGTIQLVPTTRLANNPSKNCYDCHKTGVIPIKPEVEYGFDEAGYLFAKPNGNGEALNFVNARIHGYGKLDFAVQDTQAYGPSIGPVNRERSDAFIRSTAKMELSDDSVRRVRSAMSCSGCHDGFAPINYPEAMRTDRDMISVKTKLGIAQTFVEKGWMPPGNDLTTEERKALWQCLTKEYFDPDTKSGYLIEWLKGAYFKVK